MRLNFYDERTVSKDNINSPVRYVFSLDFLEENENYTFLETLGPTESENQCLHFFLALYGGHLGFSKWPPILSG